MKILEGDEDSISVYYDSDHDSVEFHMCQWGPFHTTGYHYSFTPLEAQNLSYLLSKVADGTNYYRGLRKKDE